MSATRPMRGLRRPMPGMPASPRPTDPPAPPAPPPTPAAVAEAPPRREPTRPRARRRTGGDAGRVSGADGEPRRWASEDYAATRLANFRLPVDLHDRYRELVREAEEAHPRLRKPSLTELVIALLEEGPSTPDEVAELIRRKRAEEVAR